MKKPLYFYFMLIFTAIVLLGSMFLENNTEIQREHNNTIQDYTTGWKILDEKGEIEISKLPDRVPADSGKAIIIGNTLPENLDNNNVLAFLTTHQIVEVKINQKVIYYFGIADDSRNLTPGSGWHFVQLSDEYAGQKIEISLMSNYKANSGILPKFVLGEKIQVVRKIMLEKSGDVSISIIMLIIGIEICFIWLFCRNKFKLTENFLCMGVLSIELAVWSMVETNIMPIFIGHHYAISQLAYLVLIVIPYPYYRFVKLTYHMKNQCLLDYIGKLNLAIGFFIIMLKAFYVEDFKHTIVLIHFTFIATIVVSLFEIIKILKSGNAKERKMAGINIIVVLFMLVSMVMDIINYYQNAGTKTISLSRLTVLIYVMILGSLSIRNSLQLIKAGHEAEEIKIVAYHDALTGMENRAAYMNLLDKLEEKEYVHYGIGMYDLNNLKYFNDEFGHSVGDYYIILCSEILQDTIGELGNCYRIGGDEFCVLLKDCPEENYRKLAEEITERLQSLKGPYDYSKMQIAQGYAKFNKMLDIDLHATMARADKIMYENKQILKK
ncbi:GGDEF domain-containing protein [Anaeromicropila populeti]|uniref:Diguanylate cyclase (GGDEF) domain-containing protein n=1 Tax=Anaeromicropila populeti TaxID=37658 RepID=A0A1I6ISD1_9FIRM|nr:GGDEF domain-containing protein [Anaeromicropila populeti]SFR69656.1 diguanylate cyclase (GGDEF) domain-containing protein [Anaeromicropila populeti]